MSVVFDEVIANVEAPPATPSQEMAAAEPSPRDCDNEKIIDVIETQKRWARRLLAD